MYKPWAKKTGLAKAAAIFATTAVVSIGLCGINFVAGTSVYGSGVQSLSLRNVLEETLMATGVLEWVAIAVSITGLVVVGFIVVGRELRNEFRRNRAKER